MLIGLVGAHRTGKTTLAIQSAAEFTIPYVPASVSSTFTRLGLSPRDQFTFPERLAVQFEVLKDAEVAWSEGALDVSITDRTPVDMMAYTLAEVGPYTLDANPGTEKRLTEYIEACKLATRRHFKSLVLVRPGIPIMDDLTKASPCPHYIDHLDAIMAGLVLDRALRCEVLILRREVLGIEDRIQYVGKALKTLIKEHMLSPEGEPLH